MEALIGLAGILLGAALAPLLDLLLDLLRRRTADRHARRVELCELKAALIACSDDHLVPQTDGDPAAATETLRKRLDSIGSWDAWQAATRPHLQLPGGPP